MGNGGLLVVSGIGMSQPKGAGMQGVFAPRLNNAYERKLYRQARRETWVKNWSLARFEKEDFPQSIYQTPYLGALESAFAASIHSAGLNRKIDKKRGARTGMIYLDLYGPTSSLCRPMPIRERHYLDIFPSFLLQAYNIGGFSVKKRGERNTAMEAIDLAFTLIGSDAMDIIVIGGIFQCFPYLALTESLDACAWETAVHGKRVQEQPDTCETLVERCVFMVLESEASARARKQSARVSIREPAFYSFAESGGELLQTWKTQWSARREEGNPAQCYGGVFGSPLIRSQEQALLKAMFPAAESCDVIAEHGDSGSLNTLLPLVEVFNETETAPTPGQGYTGGSRVGLIHSYDRNRQGWNLWYRCQNMNY